MRPQRLAVLLATVAALGGWLLLAWTVFGPTYSARTESIDSTGHHTITTSSPSLLDVGVSPVTLVVLAGVAIAYGLVALGAFANARGDGWGRPLMVVSVVPVVGLNLISFGLVLLIPATVLAVVATIIAFRSQPGDPRRSEPSGIHLA
jgi:hypothetical protein